MKRAVFALANALAGAAFGALPVGAPAPDFALDAAQAGQVFRFSLAEALKQGPVVLYFYPKAFTSGCTAEAHAFAEATPAFEALGARVVGVSGDDIDTLRRFSVEACRNRFAVAADPHGTVIRRYDAGLWFKRDLAWRISYVIGTDGHIAYVYSSLDPDRHVGNTLAAVKALRPAAAPPGSPAR